jgi:dihydrofolate synthase/folylpolyglutamate synthase
LIREERAAILSYETAVAQMYALGHELTQTPSHKFDLEHMRVVLAALGRPEKAFPSVLIAGTNGKGSTAATLASILQASGMKTGLYTSPHLVRINERIRLDGHAIGDDDFALVHDVVGRTAERLVSEGDLPWHPSFFEMLTAMAFEYFARNRPEIVVLEVGMGGRLDATNVVEPRVSIITDIALDHQKFLGETITEIAREKAGIIRQGGVVVTLPQLAEANDVIGHAILDAGARAVNAVPYVPPVSPGSQLPVASGQLPGSSQFSVPGSQFSGDSSQVSSAAGLRQRYLLELLGTTITVESPLIGRHQFRNTALAVAAAVELNEQGFKQITPAAIERGIRETHWPGRFQVVAGAMQPDHAGLAPSMKKPKAESRKPVEYVFDVAHNPAGAWALRATLAAVYGDRPITMVFGVLRDKAMAEMAEILFPIAERVIATHADNPRSATPVEIRQAAARVAGEIGEAESVREALEQAAEAIEPNGLVVVTGSIYVVGEAMRMLGARI